MHQRILKNVFTGINLIIQYIQIAILNGNNTIFGSSVPSSQHTVYKIIVFKHILTSHWLI